MRVIRLCFLAVIFAFLYSCSEEVTPPASVSHPSEWNDAEAENFHGKKVIAAGTESCKDCHGVSFEGGTSGVSCYKCHDNFPHPVTWATPKHPNSHGVYLEEGGGSINECKSCHGVNLDGGNSGVACSDCHGLHDDGD